ncbi:hypothetical protein F5884DRAFT_242815 [Xylogone sp. PMI_703]|nr:hypothetical protein F5884DRAFT_242815 [Xylogone sp. PMI_703]
MADYEAGYDPKYGYNRNAFAHKTLPQKIVGATVRLITTPIGLVSEAIHDHRDKQRAAESNRADASKRQSAYVTVSPEQAAELIATGQAVDAEGKEPTHELVPEGSKDADLEGTESGGDEEDWALDEAIEESESKGNRPDEKVEAESVETLVNEIKAVKIAPEKTNPRLPYPVILPQRRPSTKTRGFVRAYAPILQDSGIDQTMFLSFLKSFHKAAQASPIFDVIMIATAIAGAYPDLLVALGVQAVQVAAMIGQEVQERYRLNKFLDQANKEIFIPRGLYVMVVTYKPGEAGDDIGTKSIDLGATAVAKFGNSHMDTEQKGDEDASEQEKATWTDEMKEKMSDLKTRKLRIASGQTHESEMPVECAPLVFPALDALAEKEGDSSSGVASSLVNKSKSASKYVSNYFDRRARAVYATQNPDSILAKQVEPISPEFRSRFADPNNAVNTHLFTLLTGGRYKATPLGARRRWEKAQRKEAEKRAQGIKPVPKKRILQEDVLYLMVVNMPTPEEVEEAKKQIEEAKKAQKEK